MVLVALLLAGCSLPLPAVYPKAGFAWYPAPAVYAKWWREVEDCAGFRGQRTFVSWYESPGYLFQCGGTPYAIGCYSSRYRSAAVHQGGRLDRHLVEHEMLHALLHQRGVRTSDYDPATWSDPWHPPVFKRCPKPSRIVAWR